MTTTSSADVIVVGAGPTGLLLAGDLAAAGVACTVLERRAEESNLTRAFAVHARTLELLDARGVADALLDTGQQVDTIRLFGKVSVQLSRLPSRFRQVLVTPQYNVEELLERRATKLGAQIVRGAEVARVRQDDTGVDVEVRDANGDLSAYRAGFVVGCDGVRSTVRELLGLAFPGHSVMRSVMLADVRLTEPPADVLSINSNGDDFAFLAPFGDGWHRVIAWDRHRQLPDDAPVDLAEIAATTLRAHGTDYGMHSPRWMSRFHSDERQVARYRVGRVFLAGDAAHVHSPAGGMGMNTGLQDAANLGWKLAAAVRGWAPADLLDSYQTERHPVGRMVLRASGGVLRVALLRSRMARALRDAAAPVLLRVPPVFRRASGTVSGIGIAYPAPRGAHPLTGRRAPDIRLATANGAPHRVYEAVGDGMFVLVTADDEVRRAAAGWADRVHVAAPATDLDVTILVRPDAYVGWAGTGATAAAHALAAWCGDPSVTE